MPSRSRAARFGCFAATVLSAAQIATEAPAQTFRVSVSSTGVEGDDLSQTPTISADGRFVAFTSYAWNFVPGNSVRPDVFVHDRLTGSIERVSVDSSGADANGGSYGSSLSADGRFVVFTSNATNLVPNDTNGRYDVFIRDRLLGTTERVSVDSNGGEADGHSYISAFGSSVSSDGNIVVFESDATNLVAGDGNLLSDVFVRDRSAGTTRRISARLSAGDSDGYSGQAACSADGQVFVFISSATNLVGNDSNGYQDAFLYDASTDSIELISADPGGGAANQESYYPSISGDGQVVAYTSYATNLVAGDTNGFLDGFVWYRATGLTALVSVDVNGGPANNHSYAGSLSDDGAYVAFESDASDLVPVDASSKDVFIRDLIAGVTTIVSVDNAGNPANGQSYNWPRISAAGDIVVFQSDASNLISGDTNGVSDIFLRDLSCDVDATWSNFGAGFPGQNGVPALTAQNDPILGTTFVIDIGSSAANWTIAAFLVGLQSTSIPLKKGGDLLVLPLLSFVFALPPTGTTFSEFIETDPGLCGLQVYAQTLVVDPGAAKGQSASAGLSVTVGH